MSPQRRDRLLHGMLAVAAAGAGLVLVPILLMLVWKSLPLLAPQSLVEVLTLTAWQPQDGEYGLLAMLAGSLLVSLLALLIAAPLGVLFAVWLNLYLPVRWKPWFRSLMELLAGIPSVVYGLWGLMVLVPLVNRIAPPGASVLTAALVLALMIVPFSALISDAALQRVLQRERPAMQALSLSAWGSFTHILWPQSRTAITSGIVLQFGRAMGETMAVLMVAGNVVQIPSSVFEPVRVLTANIALEMGYAEGMHLSALFLSGLLLLAVTMGIMLVTGRRETHS